MTPAILAIALVLGGAAQGARSSSQAAASSPSSQAAPSSPSSQSASSPGAAAALASARAKYDAVAYDEALAILDAALAAHPSSTDRARLLAFEALVKAQMADDAGARAALADAISADICVALPDAPAPQGLVEAYAKAHAQAVAGAHVVVEPVVKGAGASSGTATVGGAGAASDGVSSAASGGASGTASIAWASAAALGAAGVVALAGGGVVAALGLQAHADAGGATFQSDALAKDAAARDQLLVADTLFIAGGALSAGAVAAAGAALVLE